MAVEKITSTPTHIGVVDKVNEIIDNLGAGVAIELQSIEVSTAPNKTTYKSGDTFDASGMVVTAHYSYGLSSEVTGYTITPTVIADGMTSVTIKYSENGTTVETTQKITVTAVLKSIAVTTAPTKVTYEYGDTFASAGMAITATYSDATTKVVTGWTTSPSALTTIGSQTITVTYSEGGVSATATTTVTVNRKSITIPSQSGTLTYTGSSLSPTWSNYDSTKMTLGGTTSGTNAGTYTATFTPGDNYRWTDGATTAKSVSWTIAKAAGSVTLNPTSLSLTSNTTTGSINVTRAGNGTVSATISPTGIATVSVNGTTVTVTGTTSGSATVTVSVAAGTNHNAASATASITVSLQVDFASSSWSDIIAACQSGDVPSNWSVGDSKTMTINGTDYTIDIIGKNHDTYTAGGTAPLTFQFHDCYGSVSVMNEDMTNVGGYGATVMHKTTLPNILSLMPAEVKAAVKAVNKKASAGNKSTTIETISCQLFLLAEIEIFGSATYSVAGEGTQYEYYSAGNSKVKNYNGSSDWWWERSPISSNTTSFCCVLSSGNADYYFADVANGVAPAFCF